MPGDRIDTVIGDWNEEKPELETGALGIVLRIQVLEKHLADQLNGAFARLELEWWEYDVLASLRRQGEPYTLNASEIAEGSMLSPGALTNRIDRLLKRNFVERQEDPDDRRRVLISLTPEGVKMADKAAKARFDFAERAVSVLTKRQCEQLDTLLKRLLIDIEPS
ncbi:MAG: MarR family transcriptional regulator [Verrucomicrobiales bacterium]|nr:MarR family transcriptional regulator [Verrucomicrobiales bacterium]